MRYLTVTDRLVCKLCIVVALVALTACSQYSGITESNLSYSAPPDQWRLIGKLGVRTEADSGSVTIDWRQRRDSYTIRINGPLGRGNVRIEGNAQSITLQQPGRQPVASTAPELLLRETLGWFVPIDNLRYWVQGMPSSDDIIHRPVYDEQGMLVAFEQADWSVSISRYGSVEKWLLPYRIKIKKDQIQLILAVHQWRFPEKTDRLPSVL